MFLVLFGLVVHFISIAVLGLWAGIYPEVYYHPKGTQFTMLKAAARLPLKRQGPRALAVLALLYFLSAFIQSGYVTPTQIIGGVLWAAALLHVEPKARHRDRPGAELRNLQSSGGSF